MSQVAKWKIEEVQTLAELIKQYPVVGIVNMENIPAPAIQKLRAELRGNVLIRMSKKSLMKRALEMVAKEEASIEKLKEYLDKQPAFIFSKMNSFKLYKLLEKNKAPAPAKPNVEAPKDIVIPKGNLGIPAGPLLGELQSIGVKTAVEGGKIAVKADAVVVKKGEIITEKVANILNRIGIQPLEIGLELLAAYEDGTVFLPDVLAVSEEEILGKLALAYQQAVSLCINAGFLTKETAPLVIARAYSQAVVLALEAAIPEPGIMDKLLARAYAHALALAGKLSDEAIDDEITHALSSTQVAKPAVVEEKEEEEEQEEEKEEASEEEAISGLGALFG